MATLFVSLLTKAVPLKKFLFIFRICTTRKIYPVSSKILGTSGKHSNGAGVLIPYNQQFTLATSAPLVDEFLPASDSHR